MMADPQETPEDETSNLPPTPPADPGLPQRKPEKSGWIDGFMKQSTGIPDDSPKFKADDGKTLWTYAGLGIQFAGTIVLFAVMGYFLDRRFGWTPWGVVSLTMVAVIGGLYLLIKESLKDSFPPTDPRKRGGRK